MCGKFHTPLRMGQVRVIISCQKCHFSLKHQNLKKGVINLLLLCIKLPMSAFLTVGIGHLARGPGQRKFFYHLFFFHQFKSIFEISARYHTKRLIYWVKMLLIWPSAQNRPATVYGQITKLRHAFLQ